MTTEALQQANILYAEIIKLKRELEKIVAIEKGLKTPDFHFKFYYKVRDTFSNVADFTPNKNAFEKYIELEKQLTSQRIEKLEKQLTEL